MISLRVPLALMPVIISVCSSQEASNTTDEVKTVFKLLSEGNEQIQFDDNYRDLVILIGNSGAGKTTLGLMLTASNQLEAYYDDKADKMLIRDTKSDRIGVEAIKSKTIFPELMINPDNNVAFYDCPGFRDTRRQNAAIEFVNTIFLKKITDHARTIKVVMVVNHYSVRRGGSREDFLNLFQSTLGLIKSIEKLKHSIALIATKVEVVRSPKRTVGVVANFLNELEESLSDVVKPEDGNRAEVLLDSLMTQVNGSYSHIYFTRVSPDEGQLTELPGMQSDLTEIQRVIYDNIVYTPVSPSDFSYTFSAEGRAFVRGLITRLDNNAANQFQQLSNEFLLHFQNRLDIETGESNIYNLAANVRAGKTALKTVISSAENSNTTALSVASQLQDLFQSFEVQSEHLDDVLSALEEDDRVFQLVQRVSTAELAVEVDRHKWTRPLQTVVEHFQKLEDWLEFLINSEDSLLGIDSRANEIDLATRKIENEEVSHFVNESNWHDVVNRISQLTSLPFTMEKSELVSVAGEQVILNQLNQLVGKVISSAKEKVSRTVKSVLNEVVENLKSTAITEDAFRRLAKKTNDSIGHLMESCGYPSVKVTVPNLVERLNITLSDITDDVQGIQNAVMELEKRGSVLETFAAVSEDIGKVEDCAVLENLAGVVAFCDSNLRWSTFLDESIFLTRGFQATRD